MMTTQINRIMELNEQKKKIEKKRSKTLKPILTDISLIPVIYSWIDEIIIENSFRTRDYFLIIIAFLYSPEIFAGRSFRHGIRNPLATVLSLSPTRTTTVMRNVRDWYFIYKDFRQYSDHLYDEIINRLKHHGLI